MKKKLIVLFSILCLILPAMMPVMAEGYNDVIDYLYDESSSTPEELRSFSEKEPDILVEAKKHPDQYEFDASHFATYYFRNGQMELKSEI